MVHLLINTIAMDNSSLRAYTPEEKEAFSTATDASGSSSSNPLYLFEEEVANLLADMRDRLQQSGTSPSRTTEEAKPQFDRGLLFPSKATRTASESPLGGYRKRKSSDDEEDYQEEEDVYADEIDTEWKDADHFEEDDDEWMEGRYEQGSTSPTTGSRVPRKKAPSGTACEKHKRWKKRCPDDCPMRKQKTRRTEIIAPTSRKPAKIPQMRQPEEHDYLALFQMSMMQTKKELPPSVFASDVMPEFISRTPSPDSEGDIIADGLDDAKRIKRMNRPRYDDMIEEEDAFDLKDSDESSPSSPDISYSGRTKKQRALTNKGRTGRKYLPSACDRHKLLHAKCPATCPDRLRRDAELADNSTRDGLIAYQRNKSSDTLRIA